MHVGDLHRLRIAEAGPTRGLSLLGVLFMEPVHFEQLVLNPVLSGAAEAESCHCRAVLLPQEIKELTEKAARGTSESSAGACSSGRSSSRRNCPSI